jgi:hypothetical protein
VGISDWDSEGCSSDLKKQKKKKKLVYSVRVRRRRRRRKVSVEIEVKIRRNFSQILHFLFRFFAFLSTRPQSNRIHHFFLSYIYFSFLSLSQQANKVF